MPTAFISGHLDLTLAEFERHYIPLIDKALIERHTFVVGDAPGADQMAQMYLRIYVDDVTVYHAYDKPRHKAAGFKTVGHFASQNQKDKAMTLASDYDIAWIRPGRETSGTARNIERRQKLNKDRAK